MPAYFVVFRHGEAVASDAAVGTKPTATSTVTAARQTADVVTIEAASVADAQTAARVAYPGQAGTTPAVVVQSELKES